MHVVYYGPYSATTGYGRACRDYLAALDRHRPDVKLTVVDITSTAATAGLGRAPDAEPRFRHLDRLVRADAQHVVDEADPALVVLVHATPDALTLLAAQPLAEPGAPSRAQNGGLVPFWRANQVPILAMTTFDAPALDDDPFPARAYDRVIVPSNYAFECAPPQLASRILGDGWQSAIAIVPHAYDDKIAPPPPGALPYLERDPAVPWFTFYAIGAWGERKNLLGVLRAYLHAFSADDQVQLHLHIPDLTDARQALVKGILAASGIPKERRPIVTLSRGYLPEAHVEAIHAAGQCFVTASRGEAWNLPLFEAAARGKRIIAPDAGPHRDYLHHWYRVLTHRVPVAPALEFTTVEGRPAMTTSMPHGLTARHAWPDPDLCQLAREMAAMASGDRDRDRDDHDLTDFAYPAVADLLLQVFAEHVR